MFIWCGVNNWLVNLNNRIYDNFVISNKRSKINIGNEKVKFFVEQWSINYERRKRLRNLSQKPSNDTRRIVGCETPCRCRKKFMWNFRFSTVIFLIILNLIAIWNKEILCKNVLIIIVEMKWEFLYNSFFTQCLSSLMSTVDFKWYFRLFIKGSVTSIVS